MMNKALLRKEYLQKRFELTEDEAAEKNLSIVNRTVKLLTEKKFRTLHIFLSQRNKNEIDTWKIISSVQEAFPETEVSVPYVVPGSREMEHYILNGNTVLTENRWGIAEPDPLTAVKIAAKSIDIILIPLLAFDKLGYRAGYGGGYYDRFLAQCRPDALKIGLSFFDPVDRITDIDPFDIRMDVCITPVQVWL